MGLLLSHHQLNCHMFNKLWPPWQIRDHSQVLRIFVLTAVKLGFDQIRAMTSSVYSGFLCSLLFLVSFLAICTLAKPRNQRRNNEMQTILLEMKKQLIQLQDDITILKDNKICVMGKICFLCRDCFFLRNPYIGGWFVICRKPVLPIQFIIFSFPIIILLSFSCLLYWGRQELCWAVQIRSKN